MATFVLVHGGWHGAWCWHRVVPLLEAAGHRVSAPDLPGHGEDRTPLRGISLELYATAVVRHVTEVPGRVVLVGHSLSGVVITAAAEQVPDRIDRLVYLSAFLPVDGDSLRGLAARDPLNRVSASSVLTPDGLAITISRESLVPLFYPDCPLADIELARTRLRPEPLKPLGEAVTLRDERAGRLRRAYIECTADLALPIALQRDMQERARCERAVTLATGHSPFFAAPEALAVSLDALART